jgi:molybdopterin converting factor small subunit
MRKTVLVQYYGALREKRGCGEETLETDAADPRELLGHLDQMYHLHLPESALRVAINDEFTSWDEPLSHGDKVVFIPPVAGG